MTRNGERVAQIIPAPRANGGALNDLARRWAGKIGLDEEFVAAVDSIDDYARADEDSGPWRS